MGKDAVSSGVARQRYQVCVLILQCPAEGSQLLLLRAVRLLQPPGHRQRAVGGHLGAQRLLSHHPAKWTPRIIPASAAWATSLAHPVTPVSQACARHASPARHGLKQNGFSVITVLLNPIPPGKTQVAAGYVLSFPEACPFLLGKPRSQPIASCVFPNESCLSGVSSSSRSDRHKPQPVAILVSPGMSVLEPCLSLGKCKSQLVAFCFSAIFRAETRKTTEKKKNLVLTKTL